MYTGCGTLKFKKEINNYNTASSSLPNTSEIATYKKAPHPIHSFGLLRYRTSTGLECRCLGKKHAQQKVALKA